MGMLNVCMEGKGAVKCETVIQATLTQAGNGIVERVVVDGKQQDPRWTQIRTQGGKCMLTARLLGQYFIRRSPTSTLGLVVSGSVRMSFAINTRRRHLRRLGDGEGGHEGTKSFSVPVSVERASLNGAPSVHGLTAIVAMAIAMI